MANYKVVDADELDSGLKSIADSIRSKTKSTGKLAFPAEMKAAIDSFTGGIVSDDYINLADMITHVTQTTGPNFGTFVSTGAAISNASIAVGFKPKIFLFLHRGTLTTNATSRTLISSLMLCDDNYEIIQQRTEWVARESTTSVKSTGGQTSGTGFKPTANGVQGVGTMVTAPSGNEYAWMAWG